MLVTGANGFVGKALCNEASRRNLNVRKVTRTKIDEDSVVVKDIAVDTNWKLGLENVECVVHLAARVYIMQDLSSDPLMEYRKTNYDATINLARQSARAGVKRFIYLSTIKVNGEATEFNNPFSADDEPNPTDPYAISKYEAEQGLLDIAKETGLEVVIIRPPLVYGPGVKGNFALMLKWVKKSIPLPLGLIKNKRSLIALDNLVDFILLCSNKEDSPRAANQVFLVSDGEDISTPELLRKIAKSFKVRHILFPVPVFFLNLFGSITGKKESVRRLTGSLQVDNSKCKELTGWKPVITMEKQLELIRESN